MATDDIYQYSPGILTNILARKKAEARQNMLDDLQRQQIEGNLEVQRENMENNRIWRQGQADAAKELAIQRRLSRYHRGQELTPEDSQWLRDNDLTSFIVPGQVQDVEAKISIPPSPGADDSGEFLPPSENDQPDIITKMMPGGQRSPDTFYGQPKEVDDFDKLVRVQRAMQDPSMPDALKQALLYNMLTGDNPPASQQDKHSPAWIEYQDYVHSLTNGEKPLSFDAWQSRDANRKIAAAGGGGQKYNFQQGWMPDPSDPSRLIPAWLDPRNPNAPPIPIQGGGRRDNPPLVDESLLQSYARAAGSTRPQDRATRETLFGAIISDLNKKNPKIAAIVEDARNNKVHRGKTPEQIAASAMWEGKPLSLQEQQEVARTIRMMQSGKAQ